MKYRIHITWLVLFAVTVISCRHNEPEKHSKQSELTARLQQIKDSLRSNPAFARQQLSILLQQQTDSDQYFLVADYLTYYYLESNKMDSALLWQSKSIAYINRTQHQQLLVNYYNSRGVYHSFSGDLDSALHDFQRAYITTTQQKTDPEKATDVCINLADAYLRRGDYIEGIRYYRIAMKSADSLQAEQLKFPIYSGLGQAYYMGLRNFDLAEKYFAKAESISTNQPINDKFIFYNNRGNSFFYKKDYPKALVYFKKALQLVEPVKANYYINLSYANLADVYCQMNELKQAREYADKSYQFFSSLQVKMITDYINIIYAEIALKEKNKQQAGTFLAKNKDSDYQDAEILSLRYNALVEYFSAINNYQKAFEYQKKDIQLKDSLKSARVKNIFAETEMRYMQDTTILHHEYLIKEQKSQIKNIKMISYLWNFLLILALISLTFILISRKRKMEILLIKQTDALGKLRLQNIRNRISPHFIFNTLNNNISDSTSKTENKLIPLVSMMRKSLQLTEKIAISLQDELEFVKDYIDIESKTFNHDFHFDLQLDEMIDTTTFQILSMIIQIPVENSIKHGLRLKEGDKKLTISINKSHSGIIVCIQDNGLGYKPELNTKTRGTGTGLHVIFQTIHLLNQKNRNKINFDIKNLEQESGTIVIIEIPKDYTYSL